MELVGLEHSSGTIHKLCMLHRQPTIPTLTDVRDKNPCVHLLTNFTHEGRGKVPCGSELKFSVHLWDVYWTVVCESHEGKKSFACVINPFLV